MELATLDSRGVAQRRLITPLDDVLERFCEKLQLAPSLHEAAADHYTAAGEWLGECPVLSQFSPTIYSQGSFAIGTTTRPVAQREYDVDLVLELTTLRTTVNAVGLLTLVESRLRDHGVYKFRVEKKNRCVRLNYANDFHLDILPAIPDGTGTTRVLVPDRRLQDWSPSNPRGYARWFAGRTRVVDHGVLKAEIQSLPAHQLADEKTTLQRVVQLLKRARDIYFEGREEEEPRSIVLTTLAAEVYRGERSLARAFGTVIEGIRTRASSSGRLQVVNPTNPDEILSEHWEQSATAYIQFLAWLEWLRTGWAKLVAPGGLKPLRDQAVIMLGAADVMDEAVKAHVASVDHERRASHLFVTRNGGLTTAVGVSAVRPNTFHGD
jgi:hypothetical protein